MIDRWDAAILAGGRSRRLGGCDKALLPLGGRRVVDRLVAALQPIVDRVVMVSNRPAAHAALGLQVVADRFPGRGVLAGLDAALVATEATHLLAVACDLPFLTTAFLARLQTLGRDQALVVPRAPDGRYAVCLAVARTCHPIVVRCLTEGRLQFRDLLREGHAFELEPAQLAAFDPDGTLLMNLNNPHAYARALITMEHDSGASYLQEASESTKRVGRDGVEP